jgi:hypothetical protein
LFCYKEHFFFFFFYFLMDSLKDYVVLSSIQSAYDDDMVIVKASKTSTSKYVSSKILVYTSSTKNGFFPLKKNGKTWPCWTSLETHVHTKLNKF